MAFGQSASRGSLAIFERVAGAERGTEFAKLAMATIRAVAQGVIDVAFFQAMIVGLCLLVCGMPILASVFEYHGVQMPRPTPSHHDAQTGRITQLSDC